MQRDKVQGTDLSRLKTTLKKKVMVDYKDPTYEEIGVQTLYILSFGSFKWRYNKKHRIIKNSHT